MGRRCRFVVLLRDFELPLSATWVQSLEYPIIADWVNTFVHSQYQVLVSYCNCDSYRVVDAKAKRVIIFWLDHNQRSPLSLGWLPNVHGEHPLNFLFLEVSHTSIHSILGWKYRAVLRFIELDSVQYHLNQRDLTIPHIFKLREQLDEPVTIWHIIVFALVISFTSLSLRLCLIDLLLYAGQLVNRDTFAACSGQHVPS